MNLISPRGSVPTPLNGLRLSETKQLTPDPRTNVQARAFNCSAGIPSKTGTSTVITWSLLIGREVLVQRVGADPVTSLKSQLERIPRPQRSITASCVSDISSKAGRNRVQSTHVVDANFNPSRSPQRKGEKNPQNWRSFRSLYPPPPPAIGF